MRASLASVFAGAAFMAVALGAGVRDAAAQPALRGRAASTRPAWALGDSADADAIVRVVIENGPQATVMALGRDTLLLLPVRQLFSMLEVAITDDATDKRLLGLVEPTRPAVGFDTERGVILGGVAPEALPREAATWQQGELYVSAAVIARALRVRVDVDQSTLTVTFLAVRDLPVIRRLERQRLRTAQWRAGLAPPPSVPIVDKPAVLDGLLIDWSFLSPLDNPVNVTSARLTLGAQLLGGGLELQQQQLGTEAFLRGQTTWSWMRAWQESRWIRQLGLGTIVVPGRRSRSVDGALITNVPYFRPADYATTWLNGALPAGWEVEVQRYGLPLATVRPDPLGSWRYEVPVSYGPNELELVAYGPGGAQRRWRANVVVPFERLPAGRFEYVAAAGACRVDLCERSATAEVRYGVSDALTIQGGTSEYGMNGGRQISNPFVLASYAVRQNLNVLAEHVAGGYTRAEVDFQPTTDFRLTVGGAQFDTTLSSVFVNRQRSRARLDARVFWRPVEEQRGLWFALQASREERGAVTTQTEQLSASYLRGPVRVQGGLIFDRTQLAGATSAFGRSRTELTVESTTLSPWRLTRGLYGRTTALFDADGSVAQLTATVFNAVSRQYRFEGGIQWVRGLQTPVATLQVQANLSSFQAVSTMQQAGGTVVGGQTLSGTAAYDVRDRRLTIGSELANGRGVGYGSLLLEAFLDANGNGRRDPGEAAIPNVRVTVGSQTTLTDASGSALVRTLNAYVPSYVEIDTAGLANPMWIVERPLLGLVVRPNSTTHLEVPIRPAGGIIGRLEFSDGSMGPTGAEIELVHVASREARRAVTYSDGSFEAFKLRSGRWELRASNATLRRANSRSEVAVVEVSTNGAEGFLETVTLQLLPERVVPAPGMLPPVPPLPVWTPDTARRLDLPMPARPRRSALEARAVAPSAAPAILAPTAPRAPLRARPIAPLTPDARPSPARPRARVPAPSTPSLRSAPSPVAPRVAPPLVSRTTPRVVPPATAGTTPRATPSRPLSPDARPVAPRTTPRVSPRATPNRPPSPESRPAAPRARGRAVPLASAPGTTRPKRIAPRAAPPARASPKPPARGSTTVRPA